jgi:2-keto-4-pentenoate hydratase
MDYRQGYRHDLRGGLMSLAVPSLDASAMVALERLARARATGRACAPVRTLLPAGGIGTAYAVQTAWVASQVAAGDSIVGRKIGLTNPAVQAQLGVDRPDFGTLLSTMDCPPGDPIDIGRLLQPKIEAEVAFVLARDLDAPDIGPDEVLAATDSVVAALEIVDSRIADWDISIVDTVADNASSGLFTLGPDRRPPGGLDLAACPMRLWRGGEEVSAGSGAACLGHPAVAVAWLAATARSYGQPLRAGEIVLSGALGQMVPVRAGDRFTAEIGGLGRATAAFVSVTDSGLSGC